MSRKKHEEEVPELATQEEVDASVDGGSPAPEPAKRHRRNPLELFAAQKAEHAKAVIDAREAVKTADENLQAAIQAEIDFVEKARAALGL